MKKQISEVDYTQPYGQRLPNELPMKFHYFLVTITGLSVFICLCSLFQLFLVGIAPLTGFYGVSTAINLFVFFSLLFKKRWIILIYQIYFWINVGVGLVVSLAAITLCLLGGVLTGSASMASMTILLGVAGVVFVFGLNLWINRCIVKYYQRRRYLLN